VSRRLRPLYFPSALAVGVCVVVVTKLIGVALALSGVFEIATERTLYRAFYTVAPAYVWGGIIAGSGVLCALAFARQWYKHEPTVLFSLACFLCAGVFMCVGCVFTYQNGGFSTGTAMYAGGCTLAVLLATEGHRPQAR